MLQDPVMKPHQEPGNVDNNLANPEQCLACAAASASVLR